MLLNYCSLYDYANCLENMALPIANCFSTTSDHALRPLSELLHLHSCLFIIRFFLEFVEDHFYSSLCPQVRFHRPPDHC